MGYKSNFIITALGGASQAKVKLSETDLNIIFDGDSITNGTDNCGTVANRFPSEFAARVLPFSKSLTWKNLGVNGQTTKNMFNGTTNDASQEVIQGKTNVLIYSESVNAILNYDLKGDSEGAATGQVNFDDFALYDEKMRNAGYDYLIRWLCYYPRTPFNRSEWTQEVRDRQKDYFNLVTTANESGTNKTWDQLSDLRNSLTLGGDENQSLDASYFSDSVHLICDGNKELSDFIYEDSFLKIFEEV